MIVVKLILCLILLGIAYETWWLIRHRNEVAAFAREHEMIPRRAAANNVLIAVALALVALVALITFALVAV